MHDATMGMAETTEGMNKKMEETNRKMDKTNGGMEEQVQISRDLQARTAKLESLTEVLRALTGSMYEDLRQGNALELRTRRLQAMQEANVIEAKISEAGKYFMAFEFQLYKAFASDDEAKMDELKLSCIQEFFRDLPRYGVENFNINPQNTTGDMGNLFALAVTSHRVNPNMERLIHEKGLPKVTMLNMIEQTLAKREQIESGEIEAKEWEHEILAHRQVASYILQLRANFLAVMALDGLTNVGDAGLISKAKMLLFRYAVYLNQHDMANLQDYATWLNEANRVRKVMTDLRIDHRIDDKVMKLYRNMNLYVSTKTANPTRKEARYSQFQQEVVDAIEAFRR
jgi:hypothetical protein